MEKELKIVFSVFLVYFLFGLSSFFNSGSFVTFFFLGKITLAGIALIFALMNLRAARSYYLVLYFFAAIAVAMTDEMTISIADHFLKTDFFVTISDSNLFLVLTLVFYLGFLLLSVLLFYLSTKKTGQTLFLLLLLFLFIVLLFTELFILREVLAHLFFLGYFVFVQRDSHLENKTLRVISYQYLLLVLLEVFEYFI